MSTEWVMPKILVLSVTYSGKDYCLDEWIDNCNLFTYPNYDHIMIDNTDDGGKYLESIRPKLENAGIMCYHTERGDTSREALARSQNLGRRIMLEGDYDYMFSLESDIFPKKNIMEALIRHNQMFISGIYCIGELNNRSRTLCLTVDTENKDTGTIGTVLLSPSQSLDYINKGLKEVSASGMGCTLIHREILEKVAFTYIQGHRAHSDVFFCNSARRLGYMVIADTDVFCDHKNQSWVGFEKR